MRVTKAQTVSAGLARGLADFAVARGASMSRLLEAAGIAAAKLDDPDERLPLDAYNRLLRAAQTDTRDAALALHYAEATTLAEVSILGMIGDASRDMGEALVQLNRYVRLVVDVDLGPGERFRHEAMDGGLWLIDARADPDSFPELTESVFARIAVWTRSFGAGAFALEARVSHAEPAYAAEYRRVLGCPVAFGQCLNALRFDPAWLSRPVARQPRYAFAALTKHADALLAELASAATLRGRVESHVLPLLHTGGIGMEATAVALGLSRASLFRRLREEGVRYEEIVDALRRRLALDFLGGRKVSVNETAYLTGFSDPAAFSRAFKRWTGKSPRDWVRDQRAG